MKRARDGTIIVKKRSIFDIPNVLIENEVFKYLDFYSKINYSLTCKKTSKINKNVNYWEIVHTLPKETLKSAMLCETITFTSLYFARIKHCSICFKAYNNGTFIRNHGIYAHKNCLKELYGIYSINLKSGKCNYVTTYINKTYTDPNMIYFQGFPHDTPLIADNDTKSLQRIVKRLGMETDSSFVNRHKHHDVNEFIRQYHIKEELKRNVKLHVTIGRTAIDILSLLKEEVDNSLARGAGYNQVDFLVKNLYFGIKSDLSEIDLIFRTDVLPKIISEVTWETFVSDIFFYTSPECFIKGFGWPFGIDWYSFRLEITKKKNIRLFNVKETSKNIVKRLMILKNTNTCQCKVCKNYLILPSRRKLVKFMLKYPEKDIKELEKFFVNYYTTCWEFVFKEILNISRLAFHFDNYVIGNDVFKRLLFPISIRKKVVENQLNEFKTIMINYCIKDVRKAIVNNNDDNLFNIENKIKIERDHRVRCCVNRYRSSCKYKLCDCCCMDPQCTHNEETDDDDDSYTETEIDTDDDTE